MVNAVFLFKYLRYKIFALHRKGHGIHSPFLFDFISSVLLKKPESKVIFHFEKTRNKLLVSEKYFAHDPCCYLNRRLGEPDLKKGKELKVSVPGIKYMKLLHNIYEYIKPEAVVEIGNSLGCSGFYLALPQEESVTYIIEDLGMHTYAEDLARELGQIGTMYLKGSHESILHVLFQNQHWNGLVIIHLDPQSNSFPLYLFDFFNKSSPGSVIILEGIHRSKMAETTWMKIQHIDNVRLTIDLFFLGIVFLRQELQKENYVIKF